MKELFIANAFGASSLSDAYLVAYTIPYFVHAIFGYALLTAVVPHLTRAQSSADGEMLSSHIGSSLINLTALAMLAVTAFGIGFAPLLVQLTAPGLDVETAAMAAAMTRIIFPSVIFMGMGMVVSGILNSRHDFAAAAAAVGMPSLAIILVCIFGISGNIVLLAWGTLLGYLLFPEAYPMEPTAADVNSDGAENGDDVAYLIGHILYKNSYPIKYEPIILAPAVKEDDK